MEIKDYKQFLAEGGEIMHIDGSYVAELHQWANGSISVVYDGYSKAYEYFLEDFISHHTFRAPRERVKTWHHILVDGNIIGINVEEGAIGYTITEKQEDGSWKIIETTLKPNI